MSLIRRISPCNHVYEGVCLSVWRGYGGGKVAVATAQFKSKISGCHGSQALLRVSAEMFHVTLLLERRVMQHSAVLVLCDGISAVCLERYPTLTTVLITFLTIAVYSTRSRQYG